MTDIVIERQDFALTVLPDQDVRLAGHVFHPLERNHCVQVLVHGGTYDHRYWDAPEVGGVSYSYAREMARRGYTIVALDQLCVGASSRPPGDLVSLDVAAAGVAEAIKQVRAGAVGGAGPIALVGHSIGTIISVYAQAVHHPADLLVTTGLGHEPVAGSPFPPGVVEAAMQSEYVDLPPAARCGAFYDASTADPAVIEMDNAILRQPIARALLADAFQASADNTASRVAEVTGPVFVQLGGRDVIGPAALAAGESQHWRATTDVAVEVIDDIGHCFNLHPANRASWDGIDRYLRSRLVG